MRGPDAPEERDRRWRRPILSRGRPDNLAVQHLAKELDHFESHAAKTQREHIVAQDNHRAHFRNRERLADAAGMAADKIELQLAERIQLNFDIGEFAETGADPIDDLALLENFFDNRARLANSIPRFVI